MDRIESEIGEWRAFVERSPAVDNGDIEELEAHLRDQMADLTSVGLTADEAFLIAVKRMGSLSELSREFAQEHSGRLWRQLVESETPDGADGTGAWADMLGFALGAAVTIQIARLVANFPSEEPTWLLRNLSLFVLPFLAGYFIRRRGLSGRHVLLAAVPFALAAVLVNVYPFAGGGSTEILAATHLPVALWFAVAYPYMGGVLSSHERRMDFARFTGEWLIYYVLIALGGGVLTALATLILEPAGVDPGQITEWVLPSGAAGAVIVSAWLVESKQRVVENMAPVLTTIFTPLFGVMLSVAAIVYLVTGLGDVFDRELVGIFDALLVVVLGLVLYRISARDTTSAPTWMDRIQLITVLGALFLDLVVLGAMVARIGDLGFTPNRTAAIGLNLVLLVDLAGAAWLTSRFLAGRGSFHRVERWQTTYLPIFAIWATAVVTMLPPLFSFS